jgi:hypothetical protein
MSYSIVGSIIDPIIERAPVVRGFRLARLRIAALVLLAMWGLLSGASPMRVYAHDPYVENPDAEWGGLDNPWQAPDALNSYALYGRLDPFGDVDVFAYQFAGPAARWPVETLIPVCGQHFEVFFPSMAVIGPGLDAPSEDVLKRLPVQVPEGMGVRLLEEANKPEPRPSEVNRHAGLVYLQTGFTTDIPQAGQYVVVLWEPEGHVGGYIFASGRKEVFPADRAAERAIALGLIASGQWMRQDCTAPLATLSCPATPPDALGPFYKPNAPLRNQVGAGYTLTGTVRDSSTCLPIRNAMIEAWQVNEQAQYTDDKRGTFYSNKQGGYRFDSNLPLAYGGRPPHIHLRISAPGYRTLVTQHYPPPGQPGDTFAINLIPD